MKEFISKLLLLGLFFVSSYGLLVHLLSSSDVDEHYYKFTQEATGLILGISRAGEGINPQILDQELSMARTKAPIVNFALNKYQSPYGEIYLKAIEKKIGGLNDGIFILSIAPGNFTAPRYLNEQEILEMDQKMSIGKIKNFTKSPNYNYIINCYSKPLYTALDLEPSQNPVFHNNGWQEAKLESPDFSISPDLMLQWKEMNMREYRRILKREAVSDYRIHQFKNTLETLKSKGEVFLVRMPADCDIITEENELWPDFKDKFELIAQNYEVPFWDYADSCDQYTFYDGSHLESKSANEFTLKLAQRVNTFMDR